MSLLMALPVMALFLVGAPKAQAQDLSRTLPVWAVLDFANPSGYGSTDVGRLASDSFVVELAKLNRYSVLPRQDLLNGITSNNLTPPLNLTSILKLGQSLGVSAIVAGEIASVSFSQDHRQAKVSLVVRVIDPRSGLLLNGALAEGSSNVRPIPVTDEESLINEAFGNAAFNAVKQISKFNLPVATVLIGRGINSVTLNKGSRDGLYNGLDMIVTRNGVVTGTIRVSDVSNNDANAVVTDQGQGIRPEDRATAIYKLPSYGIDRGVGSFRTASAADVGSDTPVHSEKHNAFKGLGGILVALLAGALIVAAVRAGHSEKSLGGAAVQGPHAVAGRAALIGGAQDSTLPTGLNIPKNGFVYVPVAVRISSDVGNINPNNFLEYHVYRSDSPAALSSPASLGVTATQSGGNNNNNNNNNNNGGNNNNNSTFSFGQVPLLAQAGHGNLVVYDTPNGITSINASKPDLTDNTQLLTVAASTVGTAATTTTTGNITIGQPIAGTGLTFGQRVFYSVEGLYIQPATTGTGTLNPGTNNGNNTNNNNNNNTNGNNNNNSSNNNNTGTNSNNNNTNNSNNNNNTSGFGHDQTYQLTGLRNTNYVTLIEPVTPAADAANSTGLNNVNFTIPATRGGTDYVLEISTDPGFANARRYKPQPGSYTAPASNPTNFGVKISTQSNTVVIFNNINLTTDFPNGTQFFYRVGARDILNGSSEGDNPYIFNDPLPVILDRSGADRAALLNSRIRTQNRTRSRY